MKLDYRFFGGSPGECTDLGNMVGKHTKGNAQGDKTERPNTRVIAKSSFGELTSVSELFDKLFPSS